MTMFPIFMIGLLVGVIATIIYFEIKKDAPSEVKLHVQEREIKQQKSDNEMLHDLVDRLYKKIDTLEKELNEYKK